MNATVGPIPVTGIVGKPGKKLVVPLDIVKARAAFRTVYDMVPERRINSSGRHKMLELPIGRTIIHGEIRSLEFVIFSKSAYDFSELPRATVLGGVNRVDAYLQLGGNIFRSALVNRQELKRANRSSGEPSTFAKYPHGPRDDRAVAFFPPNRLKFR